MKPGQAITYIDVGGASHTAYIEAVDGAGGSGWKKLDVALTDGRRFHAVPNERDRASDGACWVQIGEDVPEEPAPEPEPTKAPEPDAEVVAADDGEGAVEEDAPATEPEPRRRGRPRKNK